MIFCYTLNSTEIHEIEADNWDDVHVKLRAILNTTQYPPPKLTIWQKEDNSYIATRIKEYVDFLWMKYHMNIIIHESMLLEKYGTWWILSDISKMTTKRDEVVAQMKLIRGSLEAHNVNFEEWLQKALKNHPTLAGEV